VAIDTENKRRSVMNIFFPWTMLPVPDASVDDEDRYAIGDVYAGTDVGEGKTPVKMITHMARRN
jgi:hypothetical protein